MKRLSIVIVWLLAFFSITLSSLPAMAIYVGGIINTDTVWDQTVSPYIIDSNVQVAEGATLTIAPGVKVVRGESSVEIQLWGSLNAIGSRSSRIIFDAVTIIRKEIDTAINMDYTVLKGEAYGGSSQIYSSNINLTNSILEDGTQVYLRGQDSFVENNIFDDSELIVQNNDTSVVRNNYFYLDRLNNESLLIDSYTSNMIVEYNSFVSTDEVAVRIGRGDVPTDVLIANNYWNTTDTTVIDSMIWDANDDLNIAGRAVYSPFLTLPHPDTPNPVPVPAAVWLLGSGLVGLFGLRRKMKS